MPRSTHKCLNIYCPSIYIYLASERSERDTLRSVQSRIEIIRECGSTLYVGLARALSPTNTNFRLTFLLIRLQEALYEDLAV